MIFVAKGEQPERQTCFAHRALRGKHSLSEIKAGANA